MYIPMSEGHSFCQCMHVVSTILAYILAKITLLFCFLSVLGLATNEDNKKDKWRGLRGNS